MNLIKVVSGKAQTTSIAKTILALVAAFAGFLFREAYVFFNPSSSYGIGGIVVGIIFVGGGVVAIFFAALPFVNVSSIKALKNIQSTVENEESHLTPAQVQEIENLLSVIESFASKEGVSLANLINEMLVHSIVSKQSTTTAHASSSNITITDPVNNKSPDATGSGDSVSNTSKKV